MSATTLTAHQSAQAGTPKPGSGASASVGSRYSGRKPSRTTRPAQPSVPVALTSAVKRTRLPA